LEAKLRDLQARNIALGNRLKDLRERRENGWIDEGRYTALARELDRERIGILLQLQEILGKAPSTRDPELDSIIQDAVRGEDEAVLMDRLAVVAKNKGLGATIVEKLNEHRGTIVSWLVEIGIALAKHGLGG
jgi:hypothetical protein